MGSGKEAFDSGFGPHPARTFRSAPASKPTPMRIDLFSDIVCPWCFIGSERLSDVLARRGIEAEIVHRPFLLAPSTPPGGTDLRDDLRRKYGVDAQVLFARAEAAAREAGIPLDFARVQRGYPTVGAHTLARHAAGPAQRELVRSLYRAYFLDGRDVADPDVLAEIGGRHGVDEATTRRVVADPAELDRTRAEADEAGRLGITGVPFFVFDGRLAMSGAQPERVFDQVLDRLAV